MREVQTKQFIQDRKAIASDRLFANGAAKDGSSSGTVSGNDSKDAVQRKTKLAMLGSPVVSIGPFRMITIGHESGIDRRSSKINMRMNFPNVRQETGVKARSLELCAKKIE